MSDTIARDITAILEANFGLILSRRRALTVAMIHKISETWKIPADLLVRPYKIERAA